MQITIDMIICFFIGLDIGFSITPLIILYLKKVLKDIFE